jgi:hypothetical protein
MAEVGGGNIWLQRSRGTIADPEDVVAGDALGSLQFVGVCQSGTFYNIAAQINVEAQSVGSFIGGRIVFGTHTDSSGSPLHRMRIDADGGVVLRSDPAVDLSGGSKGAGTINAAGVYVNGTELPPVVATGTGVPSFTPSQRMLYIRQDGGANTTLYVYEGASWTAK